MGIFSGKMNASVLVDDAQALVSIFEDFTKKNFTHRDMDLEVVDQRELEKGLFNSIDTLTESPSSLGICSLREPYDSDFPAIEIMYLTLKDIPYLQNSGLDDSGKKKAYVFGMRKDERKLSGSLKSKKYQEALIQHQKNNNTVLGSFEKKEIKEKVEKDLLKKTIPTTQVIECLLVPDDGLLYVFANGKILEEIIIWFMATFNCILDKQSLPQWGTQEIGFPKEYLNVIETKNPQTSVHDFILWALYSLYKNGNALPENLQPAGSFSLCREKDIKTVVECNEEVVMSEELLHKFLQPFRSEACKLFSGKFEFFAVDCFPLSFSIKGDIGLYPSILCPQYDKILKVLKNDAIMETGEILGGDEIAENIKIRYFLMRKGFDTCQALLNMYITDKNRDKSIDWL